MIPFFFANNAFITLLITGQIFIIKEPMEL